MNTSVSQNDAAATDEDPLAGLVPVTVEGETSGNLAAPAGMAGMAGDFSQKDFVIPGLKIVAKTGVLSDEFTPGNIVYNKEIVLSDGKDPVMVIPLSLRKVWVEEVDYDSGIMPRRFEALSEAHAAGFSNEWGSEKRVVEQATIIFLVPIEEGHASLEAPEHLRPFIEKQNNRAGCKEPKFGYTRAMFVCQGSAYNAVAKPLITAGFSGHLRSGLHHGTFALTSHIKNFKTNSWWAPKLVSAGKNSPEMVEWLDEEVVL